MVLALCVPSGAGREATACVFAELPLETRHGFLLHALSYRQHEPATRAAILLHDWAQVGSSCWGELPAELCARGFDVLIPDLCGQGPSEMPGMLWLSRRDLAMLEWLDVTALLGWVGSSVDSIAVLCVGWAGWVAPQLVGEDWRVRHVVWICPQGEIEEGRRWDLPHRSSLELLLVSSEKEIESSALAGDLFSRLNPGVELRLFSQSESGCSILSKTYFRTGLLDWLCAQPKFQSPGRQ